ncbi:MAG: ATP-dependent Clp protease ATP-binding subunit [Candidatus Liptonbacteria bacterium]|nr:ATP-dependent Clp protease ATP-binding subunit [Candidatus Liptonbacteria bacterium]
MRYNRAMSRSVGNADCEWGPAQKVNVDQVGEMEKPILDRLHKRIVGQEEAVCALAQAVAQRELFGANRGGRPVACFLFAGPTGVGKTELALALAEALHGVPSVLRIDCAEFQMRHEVAKLIGAPPGFIGHRETRPILTDQALAAVTSNRSPIQVVLFDEIEKADDTLYKLLLGVLDGGTLKLGDGSRVDFRNAIIIFTSNLGSADVRERTNSRHFGFSRPDAEVGPRDNRPIYIRAVGKHFSPEFINRLDKTITFESLKPEQVRQIMQLEIGRLNCRSAYPDSSMDLRTDPDISKLSREVENSPGKEKGFLVVLDESAEEYLLKEGYSEAYGAREMRRVLEEEVFQKGVRAIDNKSLRRGSLLGVSWNGERLEYSAYEVATGTDLTAARIWMRTIGDMIGRRSAAAAAAST